MKIARRSSFLLLLLFAVLGSTPIVNGGEHTTMTLRIELEAASAAAESFTFTIRLTNTGSELLVLELLGREVAFDLVIEDEAGGEIWRKLDDNPQPAILRLVPLEPGDDFELTHVWDRRSNDGGPVGPGTYQVSGVIPTSGEPLAAGPVALELVSS